jgi:hypothetical protein
LDGPLLDVNALVTASEGAVYAGVKVSTICKWRERGHLPVATDEQGNEIRNARGQRLYRLLDIAKAEHATGERAEKMAQGLGRRAFPAAA